mmetsp:Transcript_29327/g.76866  ORF Transcript_29327/g.76866 Transcript_29327/m.76866 type:complete len:339 (-) Transcript_29327:18-1034(-)
MAADLVNQGRQLIEVSILCRPGYPKTEAINNATIDERLLRQEWDVMIIRDHKQPQPGCCGLGGMVHRPIGPHELALQCRFDIGQLGVREARPCAASTADAAIQWIRPTAGLVLTSLVCPGEQAARCSWRCPRRRIAPSTSFESPLAAVVSSHCVSVLEVLRIRALRARRAWRWRRRRQRRSVVVAPEIVNYNPCNLGARGPCKRRKSSGALEQSCRAAGACRPRNKVPVGITREQWLRVHHIRVVRVVENTAFGSCDKHAIYGVHPTGRTTVTATAQKREIVSEPKSTVTWAVHGGYNSPPTDVVCRRVVAIRHGARRRRMVDADPTLVVDRVNRRRP